MSASPQWLDRIRRNGLAAVLGTYAAASFGILQVVDIFINHLGLPDWVFPFAVVLLLIGLPITTATAIVQGREADPGPPHSGIAGPEAVAAGPVARPKGRVPRGARHWLTWRRALLGGVGAFALLGLVVVGYMGMRAAGIGPVGTLIAKGALSDRERVLVAEFKAPRGDTLLAASVTEAFRLDLAQSPSLTVLEPDFVRGALQRMEKPPTSRLDADLAREIAQREGVKAVIAGELSSIGGGYVLAAQIVTADSGAALATFRETARDSTELLPALDRLSRALREKVGESLRTVRADAPLEQVTTASLPALRAYTQAVHVAEYEGDQAAAIPLLESAVAQDSAFAMAYRKLSVILGNRAEKRARQIEAVDRAYAYRDRLTGRERALVEASYFMVRHDLQKAAARYEALLAEYPDYYPAVTNLAVMYKGLRRPEDAERVARRAAELSPGRALSLGNYAEQLVADGKLGAAQAVVDSMRARLGPVRPVFGFQARLELVRGNYAGSEGIMRQMLTRFGSNPDTRIGVDHYLARLAALQGRLDEARRLWAEAAEEARRMGDHEWIAWIATSDAILDGAIAGNTGRATAALDDPALAQAVAALPPMDRPYMGLAATEAMSGRPAKARAYLGAYDAAFPDELRDQDDRHQIMGMIALAEGRPADAIRELRIGDRGPCTYCALGDLGRAFEAAGEPDSARAVYERYLATPDMYRLDMDWVELPRIYERLAQLDAAAGDRQRAAHHAVQLLNLWAHADPALQPRVEATRRLLASLSPDAPGRR